MLQLKNFIYEEDGMGTIEIAILVAALVALAIVFKKQLAGLWNSIAVKMKGQESDIAGDEPFTLAEKVTSEE